MRPRLPCGCRGAWTSTPLTSVTGLSVSVVFFFFDCPELDCPDVPCSEAGAPPSELAIELAVLSVSWPVCSVACVVPVVVVFVAPPVGPWLPVEFEVVDEKAFAVTTTVPEFVPLSVVCDGVVVVELELTVSTSSGPAPDDAAGPPEVGAMAFKSAAVSSETTSPVPVDDVVVVVVVPVPVVLVVVVVVVVF